MPIKPFCIPSRSFSLLTPQGLLFYVFIGSPDGFNRNAHDGRLHSLFPRHGADRGTPGTASRITYFYNGLSWKSFRQLIKMCHLGLQLALCSVGPVEQTWEGVTRRRPRGGCEQPLCLSPKASCSPEEWARTRSLRPSREPWGSGTPRKGRAVGRAWGRGRQGQSRGAVGL